MLSSDDVQQVVGADAYGSDGSKLGRIGQVFLDDETGEPVFATVNTGLFGLAENFVPLAQASCSGGRVDVGFDRDTIKGAPKVSPNDGHLSPEEEQTLYDYYNLTYTPTDSYADNPAESVAYDHGPDTGDAAPQTLSAAAGDAAMIRSEEQLRVGSRREVTGRARLRKYVVTENVTITVPVRREKAVLESVPIGEERESDFDAGELVEGAPLSGEQPEVILYEEVPVVETVVRPVERVRLGTEEFQTEEVVTDEVRKEQIALEGDFEGGTDSLGDDGPDGTINS